MKNEECDFDSILQELGAFGRYQKINFLLLSIIIAFTAMPFSFIFITRHSNYRCYIQGCDHPDIKKAVYNVSWIQDAIPHQYNKPVMCQKFQRTPTQAQESCNNTHFNREVVEACDQIVFEAGDATIERDFNLTCMENMWKLAFVGTMGDFSEILGLPVFGYISDRYGRRNVMLVGLLVSAALGAGKSFVSSYEWYLSLEFLETLIASGVFGAAYILAIELVTYRDRVFVSTLLICMFSVGEAYLSLIAWWTPSWRRLLQIAYMPGALFISYFYLVNESIRWLLVNGRSDEAKEILGKVAATNGCTISERVVEKINTSIGKMEDGSGETLRVVFESTTLTIRFISCAFVWLTCTFVFYGFNMQSIAISGNLYINYLMSVLIEIPANLVCYLLLNNGKRRRVLFLALFATGIVSLLLLTLSLDQYEIILFVSGKGCITVAMSTIYVYATEMFPTSVRHSLLACCSIFGRIGGMAAPQIPLMMQISPALLYLLFMAMTLLSATIVLTFPESANSKLPDTVSQAVAIGHKIVD